MSVLGSGPFGGSGVAVVNGSPGVGMAIGPQGQVTAISDGAFKYFSGQATLHNAGMANVGGATINWGRYSGADQIQDPNMPRDPAAFHFMWSNGYTPSSVVQGLSGSYNYNIILGQTVPTVAVGLPGIMSPVGSASLNIVAGNISSFSLTAGLPGFTAWSASWAGSISLASYVKGYSLSITGAGGMVGTSGTANGAFVGPNAEGTIIGYTLSDATKGLAGTIALKK
jgi:hypothetical protein